MQVVVLYVIVLITFGNRSRDHIFAIGQHGESKIKLGYERLPGSRLGWRLLRKWKRVLSEKLLAQTVSDRKSQDGIVDVPRALSP